MSIVEDQNANRNTVDTRSHTFTLTCYVYQHVRCIQHHLSTRTYNTELSLFRGRLSSPDGALIQVQLGMNGEDEPAGPSGSRLYSVSLDRRI